MDPTLSALGTWSGGRFMHFGEPIAEQRLQSLLRPGEGIDTLISADAYGAGEADRLLGSALRGCDRDRYCLVGAIGHDFYKGKREGAKGFPRFTDPSLRSASEYESYLRMATEQSLQRLGQERFDLLLLHNPDRIGYRSEAVWSALAGLREQGLTARIGIAPGPANGFTLDLIACMERFGAMIDWAMIILGPLEPWPGELALAAARKHQVKLITRVVDYGGLLFGDLAADHRFAEIDHRAFRPQGWVGAGLERIRRMQPIAERHGLSLIQLACAWNLALDPVACVVPTLTQEPGPDARPIESKRAEVAALSRLARSGALELERSEVDRIRAIGDNRNCMALKGSSAEHEGPERPDRWALEPELTALGAEYGISPATDLAYHPPQPAQAARA